jgi:hypothetical protein
MRIKHLIAAGTAAVIFAAPASALAGKPPVAPGQAKQAAGQTDPTPGPKAPAKAKGKAYGRYCQGESKKHIKGEKGTPFSQCVTAMAKLANDKADTPKAACKALSKKHVKGHKGTPFSICVKGGKQLVADS